MNVNMVTHIDCITDLDKLNIILWFGFMLKIVLDTYDTVGLKTLLTSKVAKSDPKKIHINTFIRVVSNSETNYVRVNYGSKVHTKTNVMIQESKHDPSFEYSFLVCCSYCVYMCLLRPMF